MSSTRHRPPPTAGSTPVRARVGVSLMFLTNGAIFTALWPRYPEVKDAFGLSDTAFGLLVVAPALGAIAASLSAGPLVRRLGAPRLTVLATALIALGTTAVGLAAGLGALIGAVVALALVGAADGITDSAQNVQGALVERWHGRSIMNSFHAAWSLGAALGAGVGALGAALQIPLTLQLAVNASVWALVAVVAARLSTVPEGEGTKTAAPPPDHSAARPPRIRARWLVALAPIAGIAIASSVVEDVASNWSVLFVVRETDAGAGIAAWAVAVALVSQLLGRLAGDPLTDRHGRGAVARAGGVVIALGAVLVVVAPVWPLAMLGFALGGLGCATLIPAAYAAADTVEGLRDGTGVAVLGWLLRVGSLVTSPLIGVVSDLVGLRVALLLPLVAGVAAAVLAHRLAGRDRSAAELPG
ncbi:MFS transporter [Nocardioidaceae bacterium]|nr:MFS transporter [Nocardioidaceae bacterium]